METYLRAMASLGEQEQKKIESIFSSATSDSSYPTFAARYGAFKAYETMYDKNLTDEEKKEAIAIKIMELKYSLDDDSDLESTLRDRFVQAREEVSIFLSENPEIESKYEEIKNQ